MGHNCVLPQTSGSNDHHPGRDPVITKIVVDNKIIEQVNLFNSLGNVISYEEEVDIDNKLNNFLKITGVLNNVLDHKKPLRKQE